MPFILTYITFTFSHWWSDFNVHWNRILTSKMRKFPWSWENWFVFTLIYESDSYDTTNACTFSYTFLYSQWVHCVTIAKFYYQTEGVKSRKRERENLGVELYGVQQELARHQMLLERNHDEFSSQKQQRLMLEQELTDVRNMYRNKQLSVNDQRKKGVYNIAFIFV